MNIHINGEERSFAVSGPSANFTLAALIESLAMKPDRVAVELNRDIVPRDRWTQTHLKDGDRLEIVHFVGGGMEKAPLLTAPFAGTRGAIP
ncbi:MAG: sulfur carrier protein ThiS [Candidatus Sulfotelmatobacter sp.]